MQRLPLVAVALAGGLIMSQPGAFAQKPDAERGGDRHHFVERLLASDRPTTAILNGLSERLDLTEEQKEEIAVILQSTRIEIQQTAEGGKGVLAQAREAIGEILTPEQKAKARAHKDDAVGAIGGFLQNHKPELRDRARQAGQEIRLRMALGSLDLSEEQRAKLKELEDRTQQERREIMAEVKPRLDAIRDSVKQTLESTLTDEQKSQLAKRLGDKPRPGGEHPLRQRRDAPE